jgi:hypothetical protein
VYKIKIPDRVILFLVFFRAADQGEEGLAASSKLMPFLGTASSVAATWCSYASDFVDLENLKLHWFVSVRPRFFLNMPLPLF